jgi:hypothetical protein
MWSLSGEQTHTQQQQQQWQQRSLLCLHPAYWKLSHGCQRSYCSESLEAMPWAQQLSLA